MQEDTRKSKYEYTHEYHIQNSAATLPVRGKVTGASATVYWIDNVAVNKPAAGHWSMTVSFHRWLDTAAANKTATRSDFGLIGS